MMNRRTLLAGSVALTGSVTLDKAAATEIMSEGPPLDIVPEGAGWKIRSWECSDGTWRPLIAWARLVADDIQIDGRVAQNDYTAIHEGLTRRDA